ncbi:glycosyl hydrolase, family 31 [Lentilactobacillus kisonensis F0435]|uniref:Glycosyl hydrolase, family 31 n=2 Tax=Lentilactobacillus kisonensis TaxID=481722 RepID=H1LDM7_9LACO|nr:glycosyl hydrolase, family 31 [Lentilactobacillus kisonensis F0435]
MNEKGYLVGTDRGVPITMTFQGNNGFVDFTNPDAQKYVWHLIKKNYYDNGVDFFWLDEAEPEFTVYDFDNYRYEKGSVLQVGNRYPLDYSKTFYDGLKSEGKTEIVNLVRSAWAGSQRYGALVWSGDIDSSFRSMRDQLAIGLNMGMAGIPWWTTDIGGFHGGVDTSPDFRELVTRWLQFATFCPVMRMHGDREPHTLPLSNEGGGKMPAGAGTEPWNYGEDAYQIMVRYMNLREQLRDYTRQTMKQAHENGDPVMRTLFYNFPEDPRAWKIEDEFMFGDSILVAPVLYAKTDSTSRQVYLPANQDWVDAITGKALDCGQTLDYQVDINNIPIFVKAADYPQLKDAFKDLTVSN